MQARVVPALEAAAKAAGASRLLPDWPRRRRAANLAADLAGLRAPWPDDPLDAGPLGSDAEAFGAMYVLEVSRLGGAALARRATGSDDPTVRGAVRFLTSGDRWLWSAFVERLNADPQVRDRPDRVAAAALDAFAAFEAALDEAG